MTTPPEPERSNLAWMTSLRADSEAAWAAIRQQVHRSLVAYLRRNRPAGICQLTPRLVEAASRLSHCLIGFLQIPACHCWAWESYAGFGGPAGHREESA
jgi:hypothetical protein